MTVFSRVHENPPQARAAMPITMSEIFAAAGAGQMEETQAAVERMNQASLAMYDGSLGAIGRYAAGAILGTMAIVVLAVAGGVAWRLMTDTSPEKHFE